MCLETESPFWETAFPRDCARRLYRVVFFLVGSIDATSASLAEPVNSHAKLRRDLAEQGAVVSVQPFFDTYSDVSLFGVEFSSKDTKLDDAMWYLVTAYRYYFGIFEPLTQSVVRVQTNGSSRDERWLFRTLY